MNAALKLGTLGLALAALACATSGNRFDPDSVTRIEPRATSQAEVKRIFGEPVRVRTRGTGGSEWRYEYREEVSRDTGMISRIGGWISVLLGGPRVYSPVNVSYRNEIVHKLTIVFDREGVVDDYTYERTDKPSRRVY